MRAGQYNSFRLTGRRLTGKERRIAGEAQRDSQQQIKVLNRLKNDDIHQKHDVLK